jgi:hypothetical protein
MGKLKERAMKIQYVVVKLDSSGRGIDTLAAHPFEDVKLAIAFHRDCEYRNLKSESQWWDIVVDYEGDL